jgi:5'-nucleotidase / UDP-sugar diphosphatase
MQKDFKIGLGIGVIFAVGVVLWLATLPNLSAQARALQAASNINPSPQTPSALPVPAIRGPGSERSESNEPAASIENRESSIEHQVSSNETPQRIHIVQKGDTLSFISAKYYGSTRQWRKILAANGDNLPNPNRLVPGSKLIIPQ